MTPLKGDDGPITGVAWFGTRPIIASATGAVRIWDERGSNSVKIGSHAGDVRAIAMHPCGDLLASVGVDKSWVTYDLNNGKAICQVFTEAGEWGCAVSFQWASANMMSGLFAELTSVHFHPDGHLIGLGTTDGNVLIYDVREAKLAATFGPLVGSIQSLQFSENGFWLAISVKGESTVEIWDLRKAVQTKVLDTGARVESVRWDYTGQFLAVVGPSGTLVQQYSKATKSWSEALRRGVPGVDLAWGPLASSLVNLSKDGTITVLGVQG